SKRQPGTRGSSEGTGRIPGVPDESTVISTTLSKETGTKLGVLNEEKDITKENKDDKDDDADDEGNYYISDNQDVDDEDAETESDEDEIYKYMIRVRKDEDVEMSNAEVEYSDKGDEEVTDAVKADAEKTSEVKDDAKKTELPPTSSSLSISSVQESPSIDTITTLPPPSVSITPPVPQQTTTPIPTPPITTDAPTITIVASESNALFVVQLRVAKLEKDVSELNKIDLSVEALAALKTQVPSVVDNYLGSKVGDVFQTELKKHTTYLIQKYSQQ
ncbi:hypothetical protein Tco_0043708, partial [Tanacetum coccineum]